MAPQDTSAQQLVEALRSRLTPPQTRLLGKVWQFHIDTLKPYPRRRLAADSVGGGDITSHLHTLGGSIIRLTDGYGADPHSYELTLLGALISPNGKDMASCMNTFIAYVRVRLGADPDLKTVRAEDFAESVYHRQHFVDHVGVGFYVGGVELGWSGSFAQRSWTATIPNDVERFWSSGTPLDVIYATAAASHDPQRPVETSKQLEYNMRARSSPSIGFSFLPDEELRNQVASDWAEARLALDAKAWKATAVMCGCVCEGVLLGVLSNESAGAPRRPDLYGLIEEAMRRGLFTDPDFKLSKVIHEYRNLVHPDRQLRQKASVSEDEAKIAFHGTQILIARLKQSASSP